jgi:peptidoglycan hydrolase CwlO-like protein
VTTTQLIYGIVTVVLSGGLGAGAASLITSRAMARKTKSETNAIDAKLPAEVDSVVVQGAEQAVLTMDAALKSAQARISQLEQERAGDRARITELEAKVDRLQGKVEEAERAVRAARTEGAELRAELDALVRDQGSRK